MSATYALIIRELKRFFRSKLQVISVMSTPILMLLIMGVGFNPVYQRAGGGSYLHFLAPGIIGMTVMFAAILGGMMIVADRQHGFLKGTLAAPISRMAISAGRTIGTAFVACVQGLIVGVVCILAGFRPDSLGMATFSIAYIFIIALMFASVGTAIGASMERPENFSLLANLILQPIYLLSGAIFPISNLPKLMVEFTSLDPLAYGVDALRFALIGVSFYGIHRDTIILVSLCVVFFALGCWRVTRIEA